MSADSDLAAMIVGLRSGASGTRTHALVHAMHALSQLSYGPSELVFSRIVYRRFLAIPGRRQPKLDSALALGYEIKRQEVVGPQVVTVGCDQVDLVRPYRFRT